MNLTADWTRELIESLNSQVPFLLQIEEKNCEILLVLPMAIKVGRSHHSVGCGVFQVIQIIDPEGATLIAQRILASESSP